MITFIKSQANLYDELFHIIVSVLHLCFPGSIYHTKTPYQIYLTLIQRRKKLADMSTYQLTYWGEVLAL